MSRVYQAIFSLVIASLLSSFGAAQMGPRMPSVPGMWNPVVGAGASYDVQLQNHQLHIVVAIVGKEKVDGADGYWMEMSSQAGGMDIVTKNLRVGGEIKRMIIQQGDQQPMEMPMEMLSRLPKSMQPEGNQEDIRKTGEFIGKESVTVPAGTFQCDHYQHTKNGKTYDVWVSPDVTPFGLVKMTGPDTRMILSKTIKNYKSRISRPAKKM